MTHRRALSFAWVAPLVLVTAQLGCDSDDTAAQPSTLPAPSVPAEASVAALPDPPARPIPALFRLDTPYAYALQLESKVDLPGGDRSVEFRLTSQLALLDTKQAEGNDGLRRALRLVAPKIVGLDKSARADFTALAREIDGTFAVALRAGRVEALHHRPGLSAFAISIQRTIAAALQLGTPQTHAASRWTAAEYDATGRYLAEYAFLPSSDSAIELQRRKLRYEAMLGSAGPGASTALASASASMVPEIKAALTTLTLRDESLATLRHEETLQLDALGGAPVVSTTRLELQTSDQKLPSPVDDAKLEPLGAMQTYAPELGAANALLDKERIGDFTFERALKELEAVEREKPPPSTRERSEAEQEQDRVFFRRSSRAFLALEALLRTDPSAVSKARDAIRNGSSAAGVLINALVSSSAPGAHTVLVELVGDPALGLERRRSLVTALGRLDSPPEVVQSALSELLSDEALWTQAAYGLGTASRKLRQGGEPSRSTAITKKLLELLHDAKTPQRKLHALRALSNAADPAALDAVKPLVDDADATVRLGAVEALEPLADPEVDALLARRLGVEERTNVRNAITGAIAARPPTEVSKQAALALAQSDKDASARSAAVGLLGRYRHHYPDLDASLRKLKRDDRDEKVRQAAAEALGTADARPSH